MSDFKIEKNVPLPSSYPGKYPFPEMKVGDSFAVPLKDDPGNKVRAAAEAYKTYCARRSETKKFKTKTLRDEGVIRIWRTE